MAYIITLLIIILLSLIVNRIATVALTFTGLSRDIARFQARSAFSTVGFTTAESESVVNHPVRRQIVMLLMLLGNAGLVSVIATVMASVTNTGEYPIAAKMVVLGAGLACLWLVAMSKMVDEQLFKVISWALKRFTRLEAHDFIDLLQLSHGYTVTEMEIEEGEWLVGKRLDELRLSDTGINVLGINRSSGQFVGTPTGHTYVRNQDRLILFGNREDIIALDHRRTAPDGAEQHRQAAEARREETLRQYAQAQDERRQRR